jgi:uncharacterized membrane protein
VSTSPPPAGDRLLRIGAVVTILGLVFTVIAMLPLLFPSLSLPPALWFLAMITGVGLAMVIAGFAVNARSRRR